MLAEAREETWEQSVSGCRDAIGLGDSYQDAPFTTASIEESLDGWLVPVPLMQMMWQVMVLELNVAGRCAPQKN